MFLPSDCRGTVPSLKHQCAACLPCRVRRPLNDSSHRYELSCSHNWTNNQGAQQESLSVSIFNCLTVSQQKQRFLVLFAGFGMKGGKMPVLVPPSLISWSPKPTWWGQWLDLWKPTLCHSRWQVSIYPLRLCFFSLLALNPHSLFY